MLAQKVPEKVEIVPIPGTTNLYRLQENLSAASIELIAVDMREIDRAVAKLAIHGFLKLLTAHSQVGELRNQLTLLSYS